MKRYIIRSEKDKKVIFFGKDKIFDFKSIGDFSYKLELERIYLYGFTTYQQAYNYMQKWIVGSNKVIPIEL